MVPGPARAAGLVAAATPRDYGFTTPVPVPPLPPGMDRFAAPLLGNVKGPAVAEFTRSGGPGDVVALAGPDFTSATRFRFYGQTTAGDGLAAERAVLTASRNAASVILPAQLPAWSTYLLWPKAGGTYGRPVAVNRTDAWWIGSDRPLAGEEVFVYGRNLAHRDGTTTSWVYLKRAGAASGRWVKPTSVNPYRVGFTVPVLPAGAYEIWAHNGHGGQFGWSGPLALSVLSRSPWAGQSAHVFDVRKHGAKGDGTADDTAAIQKALDAAGSAAPATVHFPKGTYVVSGPLTLKNNVSWAGDNRDASVIAVGPGFASKVPPEWRAFIYSDSDAIDHVEFRNLTITGNGNLGNKALVIFRHHDYVKITNARFDWKGTVSGFNIGSNDYLSISDSEFIGDQVFLADSRQVTVRRNTFRLTDYANAAVISWGGSEVSVSENHARDYDPTAATLGGVGAGRFFVSQSHPDSNRNFYIADNATVNMAPPVNIGDANQGEQILFEVGTSTFTAHPVAVTPTTATFAGAPPTVKSQDAVIVGGRGVGQFRRVTAVHGNTITVSPAWSVAPDKKSLIGVGPAQTNSVVYHNTLDGKRDYGTYQTASVAMSMYGNVSGVVFAHNRISDMRTGLVDEFSQVPGPDTPIPSALYFNLITNNSVNGAHRGLRIVTNFLIRDVAGTLGHLGNTYRRNRLARIVSEGIHLGADQGGFKGGDVDHDVFEHNTLTGVPTAVWAGKATAWMNNPARTVFGNVVLHANTFDRGAAAFPGSQALFLSGAVTSLRRSDNRWIGFEAGTKDAGRTPAATVVGRGAATAPRPSPVRRKRAASSAAPTRGTRP